MGNTETTCKELLSKNKITFTTATEFSSSNFWYYTTIDTANKILLNNEFWVSNLCVMNDTHEAEMHKADGNMIHALCFCNSNSEKIPMWYLYSGILGDGIRIGFTPARMIKFIDSIKEVYPVIDNAPKPTPLVIDRDFELDCGWIFYKKCDGIINYKRKWYNVKDYKDSNFEQGNYFIKDYPWEYEKEFRILIKNKTGCPYDKLAVKIPDELLGQMALTTAPELPSESTYITEEGFKKYCQMKIGKSELRIQMALFSRNKESILQNIESIIDTTSSLQVCNAIKSKVQDCCQTKE